MTPSYFRSGLLGLFLSRSLVFAHLTEVPRRCRQQVGAVRRHGDHRHERLPAVQVGLASDIGPVRAAQ